MNKMYSKYKDLGIDENQPTHSYPPVLHIQDEEHKQLLLSKNTVVVVDIYGDWCVPCKRFEPTFRKFASKYNQPGKMLLCGENVDDEISDDITGVPAFQFYKNGKLVDVFTGADANIIERKIKDLNTE